MIFRVCLTGRVVPTLRSRQIAHSVGVTHEPEITEFDLDPHSDVMLVLASDGVWDVLSAEDIRKVRPYSELKSCYCSRKTNERMATRSSMVNRRQDQVGCRRRGGSCVALRMILLLSLL